MSDHHPLHDIQITEGACISVVGKYVSVVGDEGDVILTLSDDAAAAVLAMVPADPRLEQLIPAMRVVEAVFRAYELGLVRGKRWGRQEREQEIFRVAHGLLGIDQIVESIRHMEIGR